MKNPIIRGQQRSNKRRPGGVGAALVPSCPESPFTINPFSSCRAQTEGEALSEFPSRRRLSLSN